MSDEEQLAEAGAQQQAAAAGNGQPASDATELSNAAQVAPLQTLQPDGKAGGGEVNIENILDIPLTICMEVGKTRISIRNLLQLNQGSVVELDRLAGEPLDVTVNGTLIAHGEVVVINDKFGIRLTDVVSPTERIKNLR